jgi:PII-like signaling protein
MTKRLHRRPGRRATIMIDGSGPRRVLAHEIVNVAHSCGLPMAGVFTGVDGFTPDTDPRPSSYRPPVMVVVTGDPESIDDFVTGIAPVLGPGELTVEDVTEILPASDPHAPPTGARSPSAGRRQVPGLRQRLGDAGGPRFDGCPVPAVARLSADHPEEQAPPQRHVLQFHDATEQPVVPDP